METMERNMEAIEAKQIHIRFTRALSSYDNHADAQHRISRKLASLLPHQANVRSEEHTSELQSHA